MSWGLLFLFFHVLFWVIFTVGTIVALIWVIVDRFRQNKVEEQENFKNRSN